jgi:hypothetical protein
MDAMSDSALMAGASAAAFAPGSSAPAGSALTIQSVTEFLADRREVTRYVLNGLIDKNLIEFLRIGNRFFIPVGAWERHLEREAALSRKRTAQAVEYRQEYFRQRYQSKREDYRKRYERRKAERIG